MTAGALHLHTLGTWHLADASGARRLEPGKPLALLTYLALTPRHRAGREHLIDLLWSESEPTRARQALRQTVWNLRQVIGADALSSGGDDLCLTGSIGSDWQAFPRHVERADIEQAVAAYGARSCRISPPLADRAAAGVCRRDRTPGRSEATATATVTTVTARVLGPIALGPQVV